MRSVNKIIAGLIVAGIGLSGCGRGSDDELEQQSNCVPVQCECNHDKNKFIEDDLKDVQRLEVTKSKIIKRYVPQDQDYTKIDYSNAQLNKRIRQGKFEKCFLSALEKMCCELDMDAMGLISIIDFETAGTFSPSIKNPTGSATGLIQFVEKTARGLGTSTRELAQMSQVEQLEYVKKYFSLFSNRADYSNPRDIALAIFYPKALGKGSGYVIAKTGSRAYSQNAKLDRNHDGKIVAAEYVKPALDRKYFDKDSGKQVAFKF